MKAVYWCFVCLVGCAQVPRPSTHPYTLQQKMQVAHHWDVLAGQVVEELAARVRDGYASSTEAVYIRSDDISPFGRAFRSFLVTELTRQGIPVSLFRAPDREPCDPSDIPVSPYENNRLKICWDVQLVVHRTDRIKPPFLAIITTRITRGYDNRGPQMLSHKSNVFYINHNDRQHYMAGQPLVTISYAAVDR